MEEVHDFDTKVLLVEGLVPRPPFPRDAVDKFGNLLAHGSGIVEDPIDAFLFGHGAGIDADAHIQGLLHCEEFVELVAWHLPIMNRQTPSDESKLVARASALRKFPLQKPRVATQPRI